MVTIGSFTNKKGQEVTYLAIDAKNSKGVPYKIKVGFKKAGIIIAHQEEIQKLLNEQIAKELITAIDKEK